MQPTDTTKRNPTQNEISEVLDVLAAIEDLNKHFLTVGAGKFILNTSVNPWTVDVVDVEGNVIMRLPPERIVTLSKGLPNTGAAIDIKG